MWPLVEVVEGYRHKGPVQLEGLVQDGLAQAISGEDLTGFTIDLCDCSIHNLLSLQVASEVLSAKWDRVELLLASGRKSKCTGCWTDARSAFGGPTCM